MSKPSTWKISAALAAVYLIWGSTYLGIRIGIESWPPFLMAGIRFLVAGAILYTWARRANGGNPSPVHWRSAAIIGGLMLLGGNGVVCWAEERVASGLAALIIGTTPLWMITMDWMWHGAKRPGLRLVVGLVCGFAGIALLVSPGEFTGGEHVDTIGAVAVLFATLCWAKGSLLSRRLPLPASPLLGTAMEMLGGGVLLLIVSGLTGEWRHFEFVQVTARSWLALAYLIVFGSLIAFSAYIWLFRVTTTAIASTYAYVNPLIAVFLGWAVAREPVTLRTLLASAAIAVAVAVIVSPTRARATT